MKSGQLPVARAKPKNLSLWTIRLPIPAIISIMHRMSGVALFLSLPLLLALLQQSLCSEAGFLAVQHWLSQTWVKIFRFLLLWAFWHHFCAGVRHLSMDMLWGLTLQQARLTAQLVFASGLSLALGSSCLLW